MSADEDRVIEENCKGCGEKHEFTAQGGYTAEEIRDRHIMFVNRHHEFIDNMSFDGLMKAGDVYNDNPYLGYVVGTVLQLLNGLDENGMEFVEYLLENDEEGTFNVPKGEESKFLLELRKTIITKFLLEELGEDIFKKEL